MQLAPPRQTVEHALLGVASRKRRLDASIAVLADLVQDRRTTADTACSAALGERTKLRHRALLCATCSDDPVTGADPCSNIATYVGRASPRASARSAADALCSPASVTYRDVEYVGLGLIVELDGRHRALDSVEDKWADLRRATSSA